MDLNSTSDSVISHTRCPQNFAGRGRGAGDKGGTGLCPGLTFIYTTWIEGGSVSLSSTSFTGITQNTGTPLTITLSSSSSFSLTSTTFTQCTTTDTHAKAGALYLDLPDTPSHFSVKSIHFSECGITPDGNTSPLTERNAYIRCRDATQFLSRNDSNWLPAIPAYSSDSSEHNKYIVEETTSDRQAFTQSLYLFLFAQKDGSEETSSFVSSITGADIQTCGWNALPCLSIASALSHASPSLTHIFLSENEHTPEMNTVSLSSDWSLSGAVLNEEDAFTTIKDINSLASPLFDVSSHSFILSFILFKWTETEGNALSNSLIVLSTGTLTLSTLSFTGISLSQNSLFSLNTPEQDLSLPSPSSDTPSITISHSSFKDISSQSTDNAVILHSTAPLSLTLSSSSFSDLSSSTQSGKWFSLTHSDITFNNLLFIESTASSSSTFHYSQSNKIPSYSLSPSNTEDEESVQEICRWDSSLILLEDIIDGTMKDCSFYTSSSGAIELSSSSLSLENVSFHTEPYTVETFPEPES